METLFFVIGVLCLIIVLFAAAIIESDRTNETDSEFPSTIPIPHTNDADQDKLSRQWTEERYNQIMTSRGAISAGYRVVYEDVKTPVRTVRLAKTYDAGGHCVAIRDVNEGRYEGLALKSPHRTLSKQEGDAIIARSMGRY
jgi:hypothetical protein